MVLPLPHWRQAAINVGIYDQHPDHGGDGALPTRMRREVCARPPLADALRAAFAHPVLEGMSRRAQELAIDWYNGAARIDELSIVGAASRLGRAVLFDTPVR